MSHLYGTRNRLNTFDELEASSSVGPNSSPDVPVPHYSDIPDDVPFLALDVDSIHDNETSDPSYHPAHRGYSECVPDNAKVIKILQYMKIEFPWLSLRRFLEVLFTSDHGTITNFTNIYLVGGGGVCLMDTLWEKEGTKNESMQAWVVQRASGVCAKELDRLTRRAKESPFFHDVKSLRISPEDVSVKLLDDFAIGDLADTYARITPHLQTFLAKVIGKIAPVHKATHNPLHVGSACTESS
jgi:hypothetical protein